MSRDTTFAADDHRTYNRDGSAFDVGETFSGVDYEVGVAAAAEFTALVRETLYEEIGGVFLLADESQSGFRMFNNLEDDTVDASVNWSVFNTAGGRPTQYKFGVSYVDRTRDFQSRRFRFIPVVLTKDGDYIDDRSAGRVTIPRLTKEEYGNTLRDLFGELMMGPQSANQRYYFFAERPMADIAAELGVTDSRISQMRAEALTLLRDGINSQLDQWRADGFGYWLLVIAGIGIFCGCVGKSAQFPLHVWLPDAMEGPTPVSALIHAATMVAAGVFLIGRFYPLIQMDDRLLDLMMVVGFGSMLVGGVIALTRNVLKQILAYSTISHLGLITVLLSIGTPLSVVAAIFHTMNHAVFKASLFMAVGIVDHETGTRDMRELRGLRQAMPHTAALAVVAALFGARRGLPARERVIQDVEIPVEAKQKLLEKLVQK